MTRAFTVRVQVPANRRIEIDLPPDMPEGEADLTITVCEPTHGPGASARLLLESEIVGMWADRDDIEDSAAFARDLRNRAWARRLR